MKDEILLPRVNTGKTIVVLKISRYLGADSKAASTFLLRIDRLGNGSSSLRLLHLFLLMSELRFIVAVIQAGAEQHFTTGFPRPFA